MLASISLFAAKSLQSKVQILCKPIVYFSRNQPSNLVNYSLLHNRSVVRSFFTFRTNLNNQLPNGGGTRRNNPSTVYYVVALGVIVTGFSYAAVPLYRLFCQVCCHLLWLLFISTTLNFSFQSSGYGGTTSDSHSSEGIEKLKPNKERSIKIRFNADTSSSLTWNFKPQQSELKVLKKS